jgi:hypothetical protein
MQHKNNFYSSLIILSVLCVSFISRIDAFAQSNSQEKPKKRELGSSLRKFEKGGKTDLKGGNQNNQNKTFHLMTKQFA